jgi:outer membrane immunogenic protein
MKKILFGSVALAAMIASPAMAADYAAPRRAATFAEPAASWTGIYVGGNFGGVWGNTDPGFIAGCGPAVGSTTFGGGVLPNLPTGTCNLNTFGTPNVATPVTAIGTQPFHNHGWTGGGQIGFNYQYQWAVFGIEADFQVFRPKGSVNNSGSYPLTANTVACSVTGPAAAQSNFGGCGFGFTESSNGNWLTTLRGKVGAVWGNWLFYGTMGVAWAKLEFTSNFTDATCQFGTTNPWNCDASSASFSQIKAGPAGGFGLSYMLTRNWIVSVEYLRAEFWGVGADVRSINTQGIRAPGTFTSNFHYDVTYIENIVRGKIDFKF